MKVIVYRQYFHIFFIPFVPDNNRKSEIFCRKCGHQIFNKALQQQYEKTTKPPLYLFTGLILVLGLSAFFISLNIGDGNKTKEFVSDPKVGDIYQIQEGNILETRCYFLRISKISADSIFLYRNSLWHTNAAFIFDTDDYFKIENKVFYLKKDLKSMLDRSKNYVIKREYDDEFNRVK